MLEVVGAALGERRRPRLAMTAHVDKPAAFERPRADAVLEAVLVDAGLTAIANPCENVDLKLIEQWRIRRHDSNGTGSALPALEPGIS